MELFEQHPFEDPLNQPVVGFATPLKFSSSGITWHYYFQWLFLVPLKGGIGSIFHPPEGKDYKWYISGIYCQLGGYMPPTTF